MEIYNKNGHGLGHIKQVNSLTDSNLIISLQCDIKQYTSGVQLFIMKIENLSKHIYVCRITQYIDNILI